MWIFDCAGDVSAPNPCVIEGSALVGIAMTFGEAVIQPIFKGLGYRLFNFQWERDQRIL